jgi:hypothetical protein
MQCKADSGKHVFPAFSICMQSGESLQNMQFVSVRQNSYRMHKSDAVTKQTVLTWFWRFQEGIEPLEHEERTGCLSTLRNEENIMCPPI